MPATPDSVSLFVELLEAFRRAGFSQVRFVTFPLAAIYLAAWDYVIEARK